MLVSLSEQLFTLTLSTELSDNSTDVRKKWNIVYNYGMPIFAIFILILNVAVVVSSGIIIKRDFKPSATHLLLGNAALADCTSAIVILLNSMFYHQIHKNEIACSLIIGVTLCSAITSIYSILLIAIDRFIFILHCLKYQLLINSKRARILILSVWITGIVIGFLPLMGWREEWEEECWLVFVVTPEFVLLLVGIGVPPVLIVSILYSIILYTAMKKIVQSRKLSPAILNVGDNNRVDFNQPSAWRAIKVVLFTIGAFSVTWLPYFIVSVMYVLCEEKNKCDKLLFAIKTPLAMLAFSNSLLNPIIYAWWHKDFRIHMLKHLNIKNNNK